MKQDNMSRIDKGWDKMSVTLDEKMPQKKDRRRGILYWMFRGAVASALAILVFVYLGHDNGSEKEHLVINESNSSEILNSTKDTGQNISTANGTQASIDNTQGNLNSESDITNQATELKEEELIPLKASSENNPPSQNNNIVDLTSSSPLTDTDKTANTHINPQPVNISLDEFDKSLASTITSVNKQKSATASTETEIGDTTYQVMREDKNVYDHVLLRTANNQQFFLYILIPVMTLPAMDIKPLSYTNVDRKLDALLDDYRFVDFKRSSESTVKRTANSRFIVYGAGQYAYDLEMAGWYVRPSYQLSFSRFSTGLVAGFGCLRKKAKELDLRAVNEADMEDALTPGAMVIEENQGLYISNELENIKYLELGWVNSYRVLNSVELMNVLGYRKYFNSTYAPTGFNPNLSGGFIQFIDYDLDRREVVFTDFGITVRLHPKWSLSSIYHHEFSALIERDDKTVKGNSFSLAIAYRFN